MAADGVVLEYPLPIVGGNDSAPGQLPAGGWVLGSPAAGGGGGSAEDDSSVHDLVSPASGIVVAAGVFGRTLFTVDAPSLESPNSNSIFVVELNLLDNKANWALAVGAPDMKDDQPVLGQRDGALFLGFRTRDPITGGGKTLDHLNAGEIVLVTVDEGQAVDARSFPSLGHESLAGLAALDEGWPLLVGSDEEGAIDFGTGPIDVTPGAASDGFLAWPDVAVASFSHPRPSEPNPAVDVSAVAVEATSPAGVLIGGRFDRATHCSSASAASRCR